MSDKKSFSLADWFFCDDIREETHGKVSYMGVYGDNILFSEIPATLPKIFFCIKLEFSKRISDKVFFKIMQPGGLLIGPIEAQLPPQEILEKQKKVRMHFGIIPFTVQKSGPHELHISFDGKKFEEIGRFNVGLQPQ